MKSTWIAAALALTSLFAGAAGKDPVAFTHNDWELACDNTRTCRAAGYQRDDGDAEPVSLLITRLAGPGTPAELDFQLGGEEEVQGPFRLVVGTATVSIAEAGPVRLDRGQVDAILPALLKGDRATVTAKGGRQWTLSLAGLNAVLLKMDEAQGRIGTPTALVRRGARSEATVLPPLQPPVVHAVRLPKARPGDAPLAARIFPLLDLQQARADCNNQEQIGAGSLAVARLSATRVLLSLGCSMGAYNDSSLLWLANDKPPYAPVAIEANGDLDPEDASVTSSMKGRGVGDCWWSETWHFDGSTFVRTGATGDGLCRGFAGGAWSLPRYVSQVVIAP